MTMARHWQDVEVASVVLFDSIETSTAKGTIRFVAKVDDVSSDGESVTVSCPEHIAKKVHDCKVKAKIICSTKLAEVHGILQPRTLVEVVGLIDQHHDTESQSTNLICECLIIKSLLELNYDLYKRSVTLLKPFME